MTQRTREEIISLILQSAKEGTTLTVLMYESYLSHDAIRGYLALLLEKHLLQYLEGEMKFKTTDLGIEHLSSFETKATNSRCIHQCKKCGVQYPCGKDSMKCHNPFYHGICTGCFKMFTYESKAISI